MSINWYKIRKLFSFNYGISKIRDQYKIWALTFFDLKRLLPMHLLSFEVKEYEGSAVELLHEQCVQIKPFINIANCCSSLCKCKGVAVCVFLMGVLRGGGCRRAAQSAMHHRRQ